MILNIVFKYDCDQFLPVGFCDDLSDSRTITSTPSITLPSGDAGRCDMVIDEAGISIR
jgi:hypothetical protein